jgi:hypothetical protein
MEAAGCSDMLKGTVKAMCSSAQRVVGGRGQLGGKGSDGCDGREHIVEALQAATVATRVAWN